jgi:hypothetical protein
MTDKHTISYYSKLDGKKSNDRIIQILICSMNLQLRAQETFAKDTGMFLKKDGVQLRAVGKYHQLRKRKVINYD